jgi:hypothetical protein
MSANHLNWIKATSSVASGACVELRLDGSTVLIRNSRQPYAYLTFTHREIAAFFEGVRREEFDHLLDSADE